MLCERIKLRICQTGVFWYSVGSISHPFWSTKLGMTAWVLWGSRSRHCDRLIESMQADATCCPLPWTCCSVPLLYWCIHPHRRKPLFLPPLLFLLPSFLGRNVFRLFYATHALLCTSPTSSVVANNTNPINKKTYTPNININRVYLLFICWAAVLSDLDRFLFMYHQFIQMDFCWGKSG